MATTASENAAYSEAVTRDALEAEVRRRSPEFTGQQVTDTVEATSITTRADLSEEEFNAVRAYLETNPDDGPALFASKGTAVIDDPVGAAKFRAACFNSFGSDTLVVRADGTRVRIADLMPGERLLTWDTDAGLAGSGVVTASLSHAAPFGELVLGDGSALSVTADHVVFDAGSGSWVEVGDLPAGATMATAGGGVVDVAGYTASTAHGVVWDITVADAHNYFVAATGTSDAVLVHNADELCSQPLTLDAFTQLFDFRAASDVAVNDGLADVFASAFTVASIKGLDQAGYEGMLNRLARLANEEPAILRELAVRPVWLESAFYAGPGKFEELIDAATTSRLLRSTSDDGVFNLALLSDAQLDEALPILTALSVDVPQAAFDGVLNQVDVIGGIRQLKPGSSGE